MQDFNLFIKQCYIIVSTVGKTQKKFEMSWTSKNCYFDDLEVFQ